MLSAVLVLFGAIAYLRMGVDKLPYIEFPIISITTVYKGERIPTSSTPRSPT